MPEILLSDLRDRALSNVTLRSPSRPHDRWRLIDGEPHVRRPGEPDYHFASAPTLPPDLAIDCADEADVLEIDTAIIRTIYGNGTPPQPTVRAARLIIYRDLFGFAEIRDDCTGCGNWRGIAERLLAGMSPTEENIPEVRRRLVLLILGTEDARRSLAASLFGAS